MKCILQIHLISKKKYKNLTSRKFKKKSPQYKLEANKKILKKNLKIKRYMFHLIKKHIETLHR